ncbi:MAG: sigma-E processing peptidase SpoIIGA [Oscillospiraceae bacterium]
METVYADSLFVLNMIIDYFLLMCSARVCGLAYKRLRYAIAAALGALYAVLTLLPGLAFLSSAAMKSALALAMCLISFGGEARLARCFIVFLAVSAAFGGAVWAATMLAGGSVTSRLCIPLSAKALLLSFAVCYAAVSAVFHRAAKRSERELVPLRIELMGRSVTLSALRDTGNGLYDPLSGKPVAVADAASLLPLFPPEAAEALLRCGAAEALEALCAIPGCESRFRLVPYSAVGTKRGLLPAFRPDAATVDGQPANELLLALSPLGLSPSGEYSAII